MEDIQSAKWLLDPKKAFKDLNSDDKNDRLLVLAQIQVSCNNFASIILHRNDVDVRYNTHTQTASTDGKSITIKVPKTYGDIDVSVGRVIHEAAHIKYTDFSILKGAEKGFQNSAFHNAVAFHGIDPLMELTESELSEIKDIWNIVEDARIDMRILNLLPGLTPYFAARYDAIRNTKEQTDNFQKTLPETRDSYLWAICNYTNPKRNMNCLSKFQTIVNIIDYKTLTKKTNEEVIGIVTEIWSEIKDLPASPPMLQGNDEEATNLKKDIHNIFGGEAPEVDVPDQDEIDNKVEQIKDDVENNMKSGPGNGNIFAKSFTWKAFMSSHFHGTKLGQDFESSRQTAIYSGVQLGNLLAKQLQFRNMDFGVVIPNLKNGKLNTSKLATVAAGYDTPFYKVEETEYNDYRFVFSIDASGSMGGERMHNALKTTIALATALETTPGIEIEVHLRGGSSMGDVTTIYNSKKDSIYKLYETCRTVVPAGGTPDGACFNGMYNYLKDSFDGSKQNYFVSLSDGGPNDNQKAIDGIKNINHIGYDIMGFFIGYSAPANGFFDVYGEDATTVKVENLSMIAKYFMSKITK